MLYNRNTSLCMTFMHMHAIMLLHREVADVAKLAANMVGSSGNGATLAQEQASARHAHGMARLQRELVQLGAVEASAAAGPIPAGARLP